MIRKRHTMVIIFFQRCIKSVKKNSYHHLSSYFSISHVLFQPVNHMQTLLINNEKS